MSYNKSKSGILNFSPFNGGNARHRNASHLSEKKCRQLADSRRQNLENEKPSLKQKGCWKINKIDTAGSSKDLAFATHVNGPAACSHRLAKRGFDDESYRERVEEAICMFRGICDQLSRDKQRHDGEIKNGRIDRAAARLLKEKNMYVHDGAKFIGCVPGIKIGDTFICRLELAVLGVHCPHQAGIDYVGKDGDLIATSVVASKNYTDVLKDPDELIYVGEGGRPNGKKQPEDQKLVRGNLALMKNLCKRTPVRVIRQVGVGDLKTRIFNYVYDGLYKVEAYKWVRAATGQMVYNFTLKRSPDQSYSLPCKIKFNK